MKITGNDLIPFFSCDKIRSLINKKLIWDWGANPWGTDMKMIFSFGSLVCVSSHKKEFHLVVPSNGQFTIAKDYEYNLFLSTLDFEKTVLYIEDEAKFLEELL